MWIICQKKHKTDVLPKPKMYVYSTVKQHKVCAWNTNANDLLYFVLVQVQFKFVKVYYFRFQKLMLFGT